jgi:hypothetical protein
MFGFDWDEDKEARDARRHGVDFSDATVALRDAFAVASLDAEHSLDEVRYLTIGVDARGGLLAVVTSGQWPRLRIISARRATKRERHAYEQQRPLDPD